MKKTILILSFTASFLSTARAHEFNDKSDPGYISVHEFFGFQKSDKCEDISPNELTEIDKLVDRLSGDFRSPTPYRNDVEGLQQYLDDVGVIQKFRAEEMITPHNMWAARKCGYRTLMPSQCRWVGAAAQGLIASKLREVINNGDPYGRNKITLRNWYRPTCYNTLVDGVPNSDHITARGFDLDFETPKKRAKAQRALCRLYKERPFSLQVGIGCYTLHVGVGSPTRLPEFPKNGSRFWTYDSLQSCPLKRLSGDDCWQEDRKGNKYIHTNVSSRGAL